LPGVPADDAVGNEFVPPLALFHGRFGPRAEAAVHDDIEIGCASQCSLRPAYGCSGGTRCDGWFAWIRHPLPWLEFGVLDGYSVIEVGALARR
jgi:hypothetical protein